MKQKILQVTKFQAEDGTLHDSEESCLMYERIQNLTSVWVVFDTTRRVRDFKQNVEIFSTQELAQASLRFVQGHAISNYRTLEIKVDERLR